MSSTNLEFCSRENIFKSVFAHAGLDGRSRCDGLHSAFTRRICRPQASYKRGPYLRGPKLTLPLLLLIWHSYSQSFFREEIQVKHSHVLVKHTEGNFPSVKRLKPTQTELLPAFSQHPTTDTAAPSSPCLAGISHNLLLGLCSFQNGDKEATTTALFLNLNHNHRHKSQMCI